MNYEDFKKIIDNLHDEIMVYDNDYNLVYVNKAAKRHYGVEAESLIGKSFNSLDDTYWGNSTLPDVYETGEVVAKRQITNLGLDIITISVPIFDEKGNIKYVAQNVNDLYQINQLMTIEEKPVQVSGYIDDKESLFFGKSSKMENNLAMIQRIKDIDSPCFIQGQTGTGKSAIVKYIHSISNRKLKPLVTLNCACMNKNLIESELFGYTKGAFSGANSNGKMGLVEIADNGILFLDEISEMPLDLQAKLLYFIQEKKFIPVGGEKEKQVDVRIIAASNKNLQKMIDNGEFRSDLYYRLNTFELQMPALKERKEDIDGLIDFILDRFNNKYGTLKTISAEAKNVMKNYSWPGNIREISNTIEKVVVLSRANEITVKDLPKSLYELSVEEEIHGNNDVYENGALKMKLQGTDSMQKIMDDLPENLSEAMDMVEKRLICDAYNKYGNSVQVAKAMGISQSKAYRLMRKHIPEYKIRK